MSKLSVPSVKLCILYGMFISNSKFGLSDVPPKNDSLRVVYDFLAMHVKTNDN